MLNVSNEQKLLKYYSSAPNINKDNTSSPYESFIRRIVWKWCLLGRGVVR